jgi:hypothetical protein
LFDLQVLVSIAKPFPFPWPRAAAGGHLWRSCYLCQQSSFTESTVLLIFYSSC